MTFLVSLLFIVLFLRALHVLSYVSPLPFFPLFLSSFAIPFAGGLVSDVELMCLFQIIDSPVGTLAASLDVEAAFRTVPVAPQHKAYTVVSFKGFWLDHVHPFGCASSGGNHGEIADFTLDCWKAMGVGPALKWVDDFVIFSYPIAGCGTDVDPFLYAYDLSRVKELVAPLNIPWHPSKGQEFSYIVLYLGFLWDLLRRVVSLSDEKRLKFKGRADLFIKSFSNSRVDLPTVLSISGSLSHIAFVYPLGKSFLSSLYSFVATFEENNFIKRYPPHSLLLDLSWWSRTLDNPSWSRPLRLDYPVMDLGISVDASTSWGIGLVWRDGEAWDAWKVRDGWRGPGRDIGWLEAIAVELAIRTIVGHGFSSSRIKVLSDNQGVIGAWGRGRSSNFEVNFSIRRSSFILSDSDLSLCFQFIDSEDNPADPISRGILGPPDRQLPSTFLFPPELDKYLIRHGAP